MTAGLLVGALCGPARAGDEAAPPRSGMRAHVDPHTGGLTAPPPGAAASPLPVSPRPTGLREEPAPGGGIMVDLRGGFQTPLTATIAPDGSVHVEHRPAAP